MLSRDQVLHVARLARLELTEDEIERFGGELSKVLDHIETIGELGDLEDVEPTSHVVGGRERAARRRAAALAAAARRRWRARPTPPRAASACRARAPGAARMSELLDLTAAQAADASRTRRARRRRAWSAYRERAAADELNAFIWVAGRGAARGRPHAPLAGVPVAVKDLFCTEGVPSQAGSRILEGYRPPYTATAVARLTGAGAPLLGKTNQDEFAMGSSTENSAYGPTLNPWDRTRVPGGSSRRLRRRRGGRHRAVGDRHRHRRLDPPARRAVRDRRPQAHLRRGLALRDDRLRLLARPGRAVHPRRHRRGAAARRDGRRRTRATRPRSGCPSRSRCRRATDLQRHPHRRARGAHAARASSPACWRRSTRRSTSRASSARPSRRCACRTPRTRSPPTT